MDGETQRHRNIETEGHRHTGAKTCRHTDTQTHRHTDTQRHRRTDTQIHRDRHDSETERSTEIPESYALTRVLDCSESCG
jgi:hypothetical protein